MSAAPKLAAVPKRAAPEADGIEWDFYDRVPPGTYSAYCTFAKKVECPMFKRWQCLIKFDLFPQNAAALSTKPIASVPWFLNLGERKKSRAGRCSKYWAAWIQAKGGKPDRADRLGPYVFINRVATVEVGDTTHEINPFDKNRLRPASAPYSVVRKVVSWDSGISGRGFPPRRVERVKPNPHSCQPPEGSFGGPSGKALQACGYGT
jgi:hypothetical protein